MSHSLGLFLLLSLIIAAAKIGGALANRAGQPSVLGELLAGLVLGPTCLDVLGWPGFASPASASDGLLSSVRDFAELGVLLLMFVAGLETNVAEMRRVGRVACSSALGGVVLPLVGGTAVAVAFGVPLYWQGIFIGTIVTATSVSISAQTLFELGALRSREGSTILGAAVIDDVMGILVLSLVAAGAKVSTEGIHLAEIGLVLIRICSFFALALVAGRWVTRLLRFGHGLGVSQAVLATALVIALLYSWAAEYLGGMAAITGAYLAGVLVGHTPYKKLIDGGIHPLTYSMFVPVFFISIGLQANGRDLGNHVLFTIVLVLAAIVTKVVGAGMGARLFGFSTIQSVRVGVGMISRGEVGLIVAGYGLANGLIDQSVFSASVIMVLVTTMVTPPLLRSLFPRHPGGELVAEETAAMVPPDTEAQ